MTKGNRAIAVAILALVEVALVAAIVLALAGERLATMPGWVEQVPGGRLALAGAAVALLVVAAITMTFLVSD